MKKYRIKRFFNIIASIGIIFCFTGCVSKPVLYPNAYYKMVGEEQADKDITSAMNKADDLDLNSKWKEDVVNEGKDAARGAAIGTGYGLYRGDIGLGAVAGAVAGFLWAMVSWMFPSKPTPVYKNYVDKDLKDKGYDVIGWK